jgi:hypothetical protein
LISDQRHQILICTISAQSALSAFYSRAISVHSICDGASAGRAREHEIDPVHVHTTWESLLQRPQLARVAFIGTQNKMHTGLV